MASADCLLVGASVEGWRVNHNISWWALAAFVLVAGIYSSNVRSETNVFVGAWSEHLVSGDELNEQHDLIAIEHKDWFAGRFINSYDRVTAAVAHKFSWGYGELEGGFYAGAMRGYRSCYGDKGDSARICPMVAPYITWEAGTFSPQVFLMGEALAISIRVGF